MKGSVVHFVALTALIGFAVGACTTADETQSPPAASLTAARAKLTSDLQTCTATHEYDPNAAAGIADSALAPGELAWRECAYKAARTYARANPEMRIDYELLISDDRRMTEAIQQGTMTRAERRAQVEKRVAELQAEEKRQLEAAEKASEADHQQLMNTVETLRGFGM